MQTRRNHSLNHRPAGSMQISEGMWKRACASVMHMHANDGVRSASCRQSQTCPYDTDSRALGLIADLSICKCRHGVHACFAGATLHETVGGKVFAAGRQCCKAFSANSLMEICSTQSWVFHLPADTALVPSAVPLTSVRVTVPVGAVPAHAQNMQHSNTTCAHVNIRMLGGIWDSVQRD